MSKFIITGGKELSGEIIVAGSKNATLPLMAACLLTPEQCVLTNVPQIKDVDVMVSLMKELGADIEYIRESKILKIKADKITNTEPPKDLTSKLRASILFAGPLLARFRKVTLHSSGGDKIGLRSIDAHLSGFKTLGVNIEHEGDSTLLSGALTGAVIVLEETSVTATENLLMAAALAKGRTVIKLAATEPHVQQVAEFLNLMGAKVTGIGTPTLYIEGVESLRGAEIKIIPDSNEAASFITMAAATKSNVKVTSLNPDFMDDFLLKLKLMRVNFEVGDVYIQVKPPKEEYKALPKLQVGLYPKLASDDVPVLSVLATQCAGETIIYEWLFENRLGYSTELNKMGANTQILDPHRVKINGPTRLTGVSLACSDIRNGMALVTAALVAEGQSEVSDVHHIDRGYENLEQRLLKLGADIKRAE
ncbi:MAG TPA: UDP-N-acetylglucosamine 1-carboxyvinyltransferase [Verrucomicrobiae bacterium]|nr:UDP-N-acetylglucosamine 1-carboxyvinyltransferase [Verrucomicrobiae bacterium]